MWVSVALIARPSRRSRATERFGTSLGLVEGIVTILQSNWSHMQTESDRDASELPNAAKVSANVD